MYIRDFLIEGSFQLEEPNVIVDLFAGNTLYVVLKEDSTLKK